MKHLFNITLIQLMFLQSLNAQTVEAEFKTDQMCGSRAIAAYGDFIYLAYGINENWEIGTKHQYILKLDNQLTITDSINMSKYLKISTDDYLYLNDIEIDRNGTIYTLFNYYEVDTNQIGCFKISSIIYSLDEKLRVLDTNQLGLDSLGEEFLDLEVEGDILVATGSAYGCGGVIKPSVYRMNLQTGNYNFRFYDTLGNSFTRYFQSPRIFENGIIVNAYKLISGFYDGALATVVLDSTLEVSNIGTIRDYTSPNNRCIWGRGGFIVKSQDSIWKIGSARSSVLQPAPPSNYLLDYYNWGVTLLDNQFNVTVIDTFPLSGYKYSYGGLGNAGLWPSLEPFDYIDSDSVLYVQGEQSIWFGNYYVQDTTAFFIYNFNARKGSMNWIKKVQRNYSNGQHSVAALPGNRWAISFNEYNWDKYAGPNLAVHVWILNGNGDIIGEKEFSTKPEQLAVYSNPVSELIHFSSMQLFTRGSTIKIFDASGKEVHNSSYNPDQSTIDVNFLPPGEYFLLVDNGGKSGTARFVKL